MAWSMCPHCGHHTLNDSGWCHNGDCPTRRRGGQGGVYDNTGWGIFCGIVVVLFAIAWFN